MEREIRQLDGLIASVQDFAGAAAEAKAQAERAASREEENSSRIRGWLTAANAGALLICLNSMLDRQVCDWAAFRPLVFLFAVGLACTFLSVVAERQNHSLRRRLNELAGSIAVRVAGQLAELKRLREVLEKNDEAEAFSVSERIEKALNGLQEESKKMAASQSWRRASSWLECGGVAAFAAALVWAVWDNRFIASLCPAI